MSALAHPAAVAGIDVGASGIRAKLELTTGRRELSTELPIPRRLGRVDIEQLSSVLAESIRNAADGGEPHGFDVVCVGMAGLPDLVDSPGRLAALIARDLDASTVVLAGDAVTTHVGALELTGGTVVAAGTGVVALGTDHDRHWRRADGWGVLLGDEGGGAWIGRRGLAAALRAQDGRVGGSALLLERMTAEFGRPADIVDTVYGSESPSYVLGRFAPVVATAAAEGDDVSLAIWREAGTLLAQTAVAAAVDVGDRFSWGGGLFAAGELLLAPFRAALSELRPEAVVVEPAGSSVDGALRLAHAHREAPRVSRPPFVEVYRLPSPPL